MTTGQMKFVDIAFNMVDRMFQGTYNGRVKHEPDMEAVLAKAVRQGVLKILATGTSLHDSRHTIKMIRAHEEAMKAKGEGVETSQPRVFCTVGVHPTSSNEFLKYKSTDIVLEELKKLINENRDIVKAYGEFGLDRARLSWCTFDTQLKYYEAQMALAEYAELPLFLHCREAADVFYPMLKNHPKAYEKGGVIHSFDGGLDDVAEGVVMGLDFGLNGCSIREASAFESVRAIPEGRLHFETDAPWCSIKGTHASMPLLKWSLEGKQAQVKPEKHKPDPDVDVFVKGRNEPGLIHEVAEAVFRIRNPENDNRDDFAAFAERVYKRSCEVYRM